MLLLLAVVALLYFFWDKYSPPRSLIELGKKIPGPRAYPIVGNLLNFKITGNEGIIESWEDTVKKYGNTFRIWLGSNLVIFISEPEDMQALLSSNTLLTKSSSYRGLKDWLGSGLLLSTGELWHKRRKAITPTFHFKVLEDFVPIFQKCSKTLTERLMRKADGNIFEPYEYFSDCSLDCVAETSMGTELNVQTNPLHEYKTAVKRMSELVGERVRNPFLEIEPFYSMSGRKKLNDDLLKILFELPWEVLRKKKDEMIANHNGTIISEDNGIKKRRAFLEQVLQMQENNSPAFKTDKDIKDEVVTFMVEGHETIALTLVYTIWLIGLHPIVQDQIFAELSEIHKPTFSLEDYNGMKYLERVLKESLRLYSPLPMISRLITEEFTLPSSGHTIPAGTQVSMFLYFLHRKEKFFSEPDKFDPDRFLQPLKHPFTYLPFSAGPRNCIGQKFAMLALKVIISKLILKFKIKSEKELEIRRDFTIRCMKGPYISLTARQ